MRKLVVSLNITLDGFTAGPNCELDWHFQYWNSDMSDTLTAGLYKADCILFGRNTYCGMMQYWKQMMREQSLPKADLAFFHAVDASKKFVCSNTLQKSTWYNSKVLRGSIRNEIIKLKKRRGKNILVYGSALLVSSLIQWRLVDEYQLWIHPVILGKGKPLFKDVKTLTHLKPGSTKAFDSGVILLCYEVVQSRQMRPTE